MNDKWNDVQHMAAELYGRFPDVDPRSLSFIDMRDHLMSMPEFSDEVRRLNQNALERIHSAWQEEYLDLEEDPEA